MTHITTSLPTDTAHDAMDRARQQWLAEWRRYLPHVDPDRAMAEIQATGEAMWRAMNAPSAGR